MYAIYHIDSGSVLDFALDYTKGDIYLVANGISYPISEYEVLEVEGITEIPSDPYNYYIDSDGELKYNKPPETVEPPEENTEVDSNKALEFMIETKCLEINKKCEEAIYQGIDVETSYGLEHFELSDKDQGNISQWFNLAKLTGLSVPYHADDNNCRPYTSEDMIKIGNTATYWITHNLTYCNQLKMFVRTLTNTEEVYSVNYGETQLTGVYLDNYNTCMNLLVDITK